MEEDQIPAEPTGRETAKHPIAAMLAVGLIASALGIALALAIDWFPVAASSQADQIDTLWDVCIALSVPIFVLVLVVVLYSVWKFRMRPGEENLDGPPIHGNTRLEIIWTAIPALLIFGIVTFAYVTLVDTEKKAANTMIVEVVGQQFAWQFTYPDKAGKPVISDRLYLPSGRPVQFRMKTRDVIHDFWVPAFRVKLDLVPGIETSYRVKPIRTGTYDIVCAELCGLGHSTMRQTAYVLPPAKFDAWMAREKLRAQRS